MKLEQAVERVEKILAQRAEIKRSFPSNRPDDEADDEALRIVLARAKEPKVYALPDEHRNTLEALLSQHQCDKAHYLRTAEHTRPIDPEYADGRCQLAGRETPAIDALTSALALEKPEEPFTVEDH